MGHLWGWEAAEAVAVGVLEQLAVLDLSVDHGEDVYMAFSRTEAPDPAVDLLKVDNTLH